MDLSTIIRAWKDEAYRNSLSDTARALLPEHPAGFLELTDEELGHVAGGSHCHCGCCDKCRRKKKKKKKKNGGGGGSSSSGSGSGSS
jgi:mersacidin/lichenicidin family type 2 lantibiotic